MSNPTPRTFKSNIISGLLLLCSLALSACQTAAVKPWEKETLAQPGMEFDLSDMDMIMDEHFYFSKEGTSGGRGVSAGGCGCN